MKRNLFFSLFLWIFITCFPLLADGNEDYLTDILESYILEGLENNLALKEKEFELEANLEQVKEAWAKFFPTISLQSRYTWAGGGRYIEMALGDLMNPVYSFLNTMLPPSQQFPTIENEKYYFMPSSEQETKMQIIQPLYMPSIVFNQRIKKQLSNMKEVEISLYYRFLIKEIKKAYFNYLKAVNVVKLYQKNMELLEENLRVSETLFSTGKATEDVVFMARAELAKLEQNITGAERLRTAAESYFNFLLNRDLSSEIEVINEELLEFDSIINYDEALDNALEKREELILLNKNFSIQGYLLKMERNAYLPEVVAAFDYGFLSPDYASFNFDHDYWSASIILTWDIFTGLKRETQVDIIKAEKEKLLLQIDEMKNFIRLEVDEAYNYILEIEKTIGSSNEVYFSLKKSFDIISKKYEQGMTSQIEYLDAQNRLTNAELTLLISKYDYFIAIAEFEFVTAMDSEYIPEEENE
jgi:outer membrane protein TolC